MNTRSFSTKAFSFLAILGLVIPSNLKAGIADIYNEQNDRTKAAWNGVVNSGGASGQRPDNNFQQDSDVPVGDLPHGRYVNNSPQNSSTAGFDEATQRTRDVYAGKAPGNQSPSSGADSKASATNAIPVDNSSGPLSPAPPAGAFVVNPPGNADAGHNDQVVNLPKNDGGGVKPGAPAGGNPKGVGGENPAAPPAKGADVDNTPALAKSGPNPTDETGGAKPTDAPNFLGEAKGAGRQQAGFINPNGQGLNGLMNALRNGSQPLQASETPAQVINRPSAFYHETTLSDNITPASGADLNSALTQNIAPGSHSAQLLHETNSGFVPVGHAGAASVEVGVNLPSIALGGTYSAIFVSHEAVQAIKGLLANGGIKPGETMYAQIPGPNNATATVFAITAHYDQTNQLKLMLQGAYAYSPGMGKP